uniref:Uncharacterized protein n=1 Tax=Heterorhabditis bacteriophora TaxID=37862 RepID=A0A1I7X9M3_HETBA
MNYHANETTNLIPLTEKLIGCKGQQYCDLNVYRKFAQKLKPDMEMSESRRTVRSISAQPFVGHVVGHCHGEEFVLFDCPVLDVNVAVLRAIFLLQPL